MTGGLLGQINTANGNQEISKSYVTGYTIKGYNVGGLAGLTCYHMIDDDMQMQALSSTGYIKTFVTAETPIDVEAKGKQSEQALLYTRLLCFSNGSPKTLYDKSKGFLRRMIILRPTATVRLRAAGRSRLLT